MVYRLGMIDDPFKIWVGGFQRIGRLIETLVSGYAAPRRTTMMLLSHTQNGSVSLQFVERRIGGVVEPGMCGVGECRGGQTDPRGRAAERSGRESVTNEATAWVV